MVGGFSVLSAEDTAVGSNAHSLCSFACSSLQQQCSGSNSLACNSLAAASFSSVTGSSEVVSGINYQLVCLTSAGPLDLTVYEQTWTNTLTLESATLSSVALIAEATPLDMAAFRTFAAAAAAAAGPGVGDQGPPLPRLPNQFEVRETRVEQTANGTALCTVLSSLPTFPPRLTSVVGLPSSSGDGLVSHRQQELHRRGSRGK